MRPEKSERKGPKRQRVETEKCNDGTKGQQASLKSIREREGGFTVKGSSTRAWTRANEASKARTLSGGKSTTESVEHPQAPIRIRHRFQRVTLTKTVYCSIEGTRQTGTIRRRPSRKDSKCAYYKNEGCCAHEFMLGGGKQTAMKPFKATPASRKRERKRRVGNQRGLILKTERAPWYAGA